MVCARDHVMRERRFSWWTTGANAFARRKRVDISIPWTAGSEGLVAAAAALIHKPIGRGKRMFNRISGSRHACRRNAVTGTEAAPPPTSIQALVAGLGEGGGARSQCMRTLCHRRHDGASRQNGTCCRGVTGRRFACGCPASAGVLPRRACTGSPGG